MADRDIVLDPYTLPGGVAAQATVRITLTDLTGRPVDGYRIDDDSGIVGTRTVALGDTPVTVPLAPTTNIRPPSAWQIEVLHSGRRLRRALVQLDAGAEMTLADMLDLPDIGAFVLDGLVGFAVVAPDDLPDPQVTGILYFVTP